MAAEDPCERADEIISIIADGNHPEMLDELMDELQNIQLGPCGVGMLVPDCQGTTCCVTFSLQVVCATAEAGIGTPYACPIPGAFERTCVYVSGEGEGWADLFAGTADLKGWGLSDFCSWGIGGGSCGLGDDNDVVYNGSCNVVVVTVQSIRTVAATDTACA